MDTGSQAAAAPDATFKGAQAAAVTASVPQAEPASEPSKPKRKRTTRKDAGDGPAAEASADKPKGKGKGKGKTPAKRAPRKKATADDEEEEEGGAEGKPRKKVDRSDPKLVTSAEDMPSWARVSFSNVMQQRAQYDQMRKQRDDEVRAAASTPMVRVMAGKDPGASSLCETPAVAAVHRAQEAASSAAAARAPAPTILRLLNHQPLHCLQLLPAHAILHLLCHSEVGPRSTSFLPCA